MNGSCGSWPGVEIVASYDTAGSAKMVRDGGLKEAAAIASERAAEVFGLSIIEAGVQDFSDNVTRFLVIARENLTEGKPDKTTIVFTVSNSPGSLFKALSVFALRDIALSKLESRPIPGRPWEYLFFRRSPCGPGGLPVRSRPDASGRVRTGGAHAGLLSELEGPRGDQSRGADTKSQTADLV